MKTMISRRGFLCAAGIASASAVLTACSGSSSSIFHRILRCRLL